MYLPGRPYSHLSEKCVYLYIQAASGAQMWTRKSLVSGEDFSLGSVLEESVSV